MRALKILVVVMGVALVAGLAVIIGTIAYRASHMGTAAALATPGRPHAFGNATVRLPPDASIVEMQGVGSRLVLRLKRSDGSQALLVLDSDSGNVLGTIELRPGE
ncbi:MAG TPA: hypothetical protein VLX09_24640 [Stellaceae bacterium]|nr:hypothetical protein [Stellaceae bacterium]